MGVRAQLLAGLVAASLLTTGTAGAQSDEGLVVPPPPGAPGTPPPSAPPPPLAAPSPGTGLTPPGAVPAPPGAALGPPAVSDDVVGVLLAAAEQDLAAGRHALALARASVVSQALPENAPLRIRADGLRLLAQQRISGDAASPSPDEVLAPLVIQAELDLRAGAVLAALPRLDFALARLPAGSPLRARAEQLRAAALAAVGTPAGGPPLIYAPPPPAALVPPPEPGPPRDPNERGTGEAVELYITGAMLGALTGGYIPFVASNETAAGVTYTLSLIGGAGLFAVGVLSLDLTGALRTGIAPTISSSIRFGFANGMLSFGLAAALGVDDPNVYFSLVWGGSVLGALTGIGVGFGLTPRVHEERLVESVGIWGGGLGTAVAMITDYQDPVAGLALSLIGLDAGILAGIVAVASGGRLPTRRTLFLDLGFVAGFGIGSLVPLLYYALSPPGTPFELPAFGVGSLIGSVGGWILLWFLTEGIEEEQDDLPPVGVSVVPVEGGATLSVFGAL